MPTFAQASFAKGEIDPALHGRTDTAAYQIALATARNTIVRPYGGIVNRAGLQYLGPVKDHAGTIRLIDFQFKTTDTYIIEIGNLYMRFIRNDAIVTETALTGCTATAANPVVVTKSSHGLSEGSEVLLSGFTEMTQVNGGRYIIANATGNTFELTHQVTGANIDGSAWTAETTGGSVGKVYEITTPYATADLFQLKYTQSADTMTITHPNYSIRELTRTAINVFTLTEPTFASSQVTPTGLQATAGTGGTATVNYRYKVTAFNKDGEESLSALNNSAIAVSSATAANPVSCTATSHGLLSGDEIEITNFTEMTEVNGRRFLISKVDDNTFTLDAEDGTGYTAETTGGNVYLTYAEISSGLNTPSAATSTLQTVQWLAAAGAVKYAVYRSSTGNYGLVGETTNLAFDDLIDIPDTAIGPPNAKNPFLFAGDYPGTVSYFEQRRVFGGSTNKPDTSHFSRTAFTNNFSLSETIVDTDAITSTLSSRRVNDIRHYVPGNDLMVFTSGAEWRINAGQGSSLTPGSISQKPQSEWGCSHQRPLVVGEVTLFVQENQANVRTIGYNLQLDGYTGNDLNLLTHHLLRDRAVVDWCLAHHLYLVMMVRDDGAALSLTFQPEQEVIAWTRWDTDGKFKSCAAVLPSLTTEQDTGYFVVQRIINGNTVQYIEKLHSREFEDLEDSFFVDSGLTYNSFTTITGVTAANPAVVTAASHGFSDGDTVRIDGVEWEPNLDASKNQTQPSQLNGQQYLVANATTDTFTPISPTLSNIHVVDATQAEPVVVSTAEAHGLSDGDLIVLNGVSGMTEINSTVYKVADAASTTFALHTTSDLLVDGTGFSAYTTSGTVHQPLDGSAWNAYVTGGKARDTVLTVSGLDHLEGETIAGLLDGNHVPSLTVSGGSVTLPYRASRVHLGMPYYSDVETLDAERPKGTLIDRQKKISNVTVRFNKSRGMLIGPDTDNLVEVKQRQYEAYGVPTGLLTGTIEVKMSPSWNKQGRVFIRQPYPLPMEITTIAPNMEVGD